MHKTKILSILILITLIWNSYPCVGNPKNITEISDNLYLSEHPIHLKSPLITYKNTNYIPLRDLVKQFQGTIRYSRKNNFYNVIIPHSDIQITLAPYTTTMVINNRTTQLSIPPIKYKTRVYIPLKEWVKKLNFKTEKHLGKLYLINLTPQKPQPTPSSPTKTPLAITKILSKLPITKTNVKPQKPITVKWESEIIQINKHFYNQNGLLYIDIIPILKHLGYTIKTSHQSISAIKPSATINIRF